MRIKHLVQLLLLASFIPTRVLSQTVLQQANGTDPLETGAIESGKQLISTVESLLLPFKTVDTQYKRIDHYARSSTEYIDKLIALKQSTEASDDFSWQARRSEYQHAMDSLHPDQKTALQLLETASESDLSVEASKMLAELHLFGNYSVPRNGSLLLKYYKRTTQLSRDDGDAHFMLAFLYATGLFGEIPQDQARALVHYQTAHELGDLRLTMALGYKYLSGISVEENCQLALFYYGAALQRAMEIVKEGPIGGPNIDSHAVRVYDFVGGLYGEHASKEATSLTRKLDCDLHEIDSFVDVSMNSETAKPIRLYYETKAYYDGLYFHERNYELLFEAALECCADATIVNRLNVEHASLCLAMLGHMYLRGEGVARDYVRAREWLERAEKWNPKLVSMVDLGLIYELGLGVDADVAKLLELYLRSSQTSLGKFHTARLDMNKNHAKRTLQLMQLSAYYGNVQLLYYLAAMYEQGFDGKLTSCEDIVSPYKVFVERVELLCPLLQWGFKKLFLEGDKEAALLGYAIAAEQGYESAMASALYLLYSPVPLTKPLPQMPKERFEAAITYYSRSAKLFNIDSLVFLGDLHYYGSPPEVQPDYKRAFGYYQRASTGHSEQATFNVGYMYEQGLGVPRDYHMAKRYYDLALLGETDTHIPVQLALVRLKFKMFWSRLFGNNVIEDSPSASPGRTWKDWVEMFKRVRRSRDAIFVNDELDAVLDGDDLAPAPRVNYLDDIFDDDDDDEYIDIFLIILFIGMVAFMIVYQNRPRNLPGQPLRELQLLPELPDGLNFQANFFVVPI